MGRSAQAAKAWFAKMGQSPRYLREGVARHTRFMNVLKSLPLDRGETARTKQKKADRGSANAQAWRVEAAEQKRAVRAKR